MNYCYNSLLSVLIFLFLGFTSQSDAQTLFTGTYSQDFSSFVFGVGSNVNSFGADNEWGFSASNRTYNGDWGTGNTGGFRGNSNVLGYQHTGTTGVLLVELTLVNDTGETITSVDISYTGKVERVGEGRSPEWTVSVNNTTVPDLFYSTSGGTDQILETTVEGLNVQPGEEIRITWVSDRGEPSGASKQIGIAEVFVEVLEAEDDPTIDVFVDGQQTETGSDINFPFTNPGDTVSKTVRLRNRGAEELVINDVSVLDSGVFTVGALSTTTLNFNESAEFELEFTPDAEGQFEGLLQISSNAVNQPVVELNLFGETFPIPDLITIAEAREVPFGTRVTVAGRITVGNEFEGPAYFQDATAGLASFWTPMHSQAEIGDSLIITGPMTEFNPIGGTPGTFLRQIAATDDDDNITFELIKEDPRIVEPVVITAQQMNSGNFQGQLVRIQDAIIDFSGAFQGGTNHNFSDGTATAELRIDNSTNLVGVQAPEGAVDIIGVVGRFNGVVQLLPRFAEDMGAEPFEFPGDDVPKDQTFDVVTWNIEWFGDPTNGPSDTELQFENVKTVITTLDADLYAFQEISNSMQFHRLADELEAYGGFEADFTQQQKTAYLFKRATVDSLDSGLITQGMISFDWANGRLPLMFRFITTIEGLQREVYSFNIHAKAFADAESYNRRVNASNQMKNFLDANHLNDNVLFIGDYNDDVTVSTYDNQVSPYQNFVDDDNYLVITKSLSEQGATSFRTLSMIDHITINSEFVPDYFEGTERVENPSFIGSFLSTTSDHFPVSTRFSFSEAVSTDDESFSQIPERASLEQNFPNPFNPTTQIQFILSSAQQVNLDVYNVLGQRVATLVNNEARSAGTHTISFDASGFSSGVYFYRLSLQNGEQLTRKMMLVK
ncbi:MAG: T9SS type A sorting domain-containing protein [Balneolaceae bacterium]